MARRALKTAVTRSVKNLPNVKESDRAAVKLIESYAETIDAAMTEYFDNKDEDGRPGIGISDLAAVMKLGSPMMTGLKELGATPLSWEAIVGVNKREVNAVDELKQKRASRASGTRRASSMD